ncbi:Flp pilus assembly protein TadB [Candidatus Syntrophocurvum alkaliphilum]|uniref:Flp pilus assembly protein TadB n=1 Tax=Candidatus Syntrophocurvum alkaliphilum TaxID=2293317 RepID=A0A6I6DMM9_9FIRM|nr:type II secretion system F family protein [Candidatus Syntrophocurvum alkaliphilum]QGU00294.1 Flp pilus assembly protein TadB [Candidatus Syntrophocurvum alkaliphilum]
MLLIAISISSFLLVIVIAYQLKSLLTRKENRIKKRLLLTIGTQEVESTKKTSSVPTREKLHSKLVSFTTLIINSNYLENKKQNLEKAGLLLKVEELLFFKLLSAVVVGFFGLLIFNQFIFFIITGILGWLLPELLIVYLKRKRIAAIEAQLLNAVIILANSLRAGYSLLQAIDIVSKETPKPLGHELSKVVKEMQVGVRPEDALLNLQKRIESNEIELLVTGILVQREVGGNLAEILDTIAETIDKRIKMRAKIMALTAQGRMSAWVVSILPFALALFIFGTRPDFGMIMLTEPLGITMLTIGFVMLVLGILLIRRIVNIDV